MVYRGPNRRRQLSPLRGEDSPPDASPRRHRRHGQSRQPQRQSRASAHPLHRSEAVLPAQILARSKHRSSPSSSTSYEKLRPARLKRFASPSVKLFISSHPNSAHATWQTQDMDEPKFITL